MYFLSSEIRNISLLTKIVDTESNVFHYLFVCFYLLCEEISSIFSPQRKQSFSHITLLIWIFLCKKVNSLDFLCKTGKFQRISSLILDIVCQKYSFLEVIYPIFTHDKGKLETQCFSKVLLNNQAKVLFFNHDYLCHMLMKTLTKLHCIISKIKMKNYILRKFYQKQNYLTGQSC